MLNLRPMTAYRLTVLRKEDLREITVKCGACRAVMTVECGEPRTTTALMRACGACGKQFEDHALRVIEAFMKLHAALNNSQTEFEFPVRSALD